MENIDNEFKSARRERVREQKERRGACVDIIGNL